MGAYAVGEATKVKIYETAKELFYEKGVEATSYTDICERANVNRGLIPYHFKSKNNIAMLVLDDFIESMEGAVLERWPQSEVSQTVRDVLLELFQFRMLEGNRSILRFYGEIVGSADYHEKMFEVQKTVLEKMVASTETDLTAVAWPTITCMMAGTEIELVQALRAGYLEESVEDYVRRDLRWVYFLIGADDDKVNEWCDEAYALAQGLTMECGPDFVCRIVAE